MARLKKDEDRKLDVSHSFVSRLRISSQTNKMCSKRHGACRVRSMTPGEDRRIVLLTKRNRHSTSERSKSVDTIGK
ncbi:hypothetical protein HNY73_001008 [Argiope bruennichi]|uniref:Uncharacterized protein n=1 Tax=Argiope bruennichi TaxID=94029 RepID=A0A8T0G469_ARGBR|nr:hypothetical protein HNY73_001008 [Argiope bruennichi]